MKRRRPIFVPSVGNFKQGMLVSVPIHLDGLPGKPRIKDVEAQSLPGHTELIEQLKYDGKTTGPEAAVKILQVEKETRTIHRDKLKADALAPVSQPVISTTSSVGSQHGSGVEDKAKEREKLIAAHQAEHKCDYRSAAFAVSKARPELFRDR